MRIFGEALETASTERSPDEIDGRGQENVNALGAGLAAERQSQLFDQLDVPGRAECDRARQGGRGIIRIESNPAHPCGAVGHDKGPEAYLGDVVEGPGVTPREQTYLLLEVEPSYKGGFITRNPDGGARHRLPPSSFLD